MADLSQHLKKLDTLREGIDELDTQLVELLAKRNQITTQVGQIKLKLVCPFMYQSVKKR